MRLLILLLLLGCGTDRMQFKCIQGTYFGKRPSSTIWKDYGARRCINDKELESGF